MTPKISVFIVAYNQEKFIEEAIESVLNQKTNFYFEIVVAEDYSTDRTRDILISYQNRYPDRIRLILNNENKGAQRNFAQVATACKGEYIALLDGDDKWTSALKLQTQADFLDANTSMTICFHKAKVISEFTNNNEYSDVIPIDDRKEYSIYDLFEGNFMPTSSVMYRNSLFQSLPEWYFNLHIGDLPLHLLNSHFGQIGSINQVMSIYRVHDGGIWSLQHRKRTIYNLEKKIEMFGNFNTYTNLKYNEYLTSKIKHLSTLLIIERGKGIKDNKSMNEYYTNSLKNLRVELGDFNQYSQTKTNNKNKKIVLFGTGSFANNLIEFCEIMDIHIGYCCDNNNNLWGTYFETYRVNNPLLLLIEDNENLLIVIGSMYYHSIAKQLIEMGFEEGKHFQHGLDFIYNCI